ncbi:MAG: glycoside hydrolase family 15 protein [Betaproteobacteria bacterium]|nr:glycoside hydrolase family 15 protein [Betaproteobacteria bacterium]
MSKREGNVTNLDLGVIGNCTVNAAIDAMGRVVWSCYPRPDGDPVFYALLNGPDPFAPPGRGFCSIEIENIAHAEQRYVHNTAVLKTFLHDAAGNALEITDFSPRFELYGRMFCPASFVRRIKPLSGRPRIIVRMRPGFEYGKAAPDLTRGSHHVRYVLPGLTLRLTTDLPVSYVVDETRFVLDEPANLIIGPDEPIAEPIPGLARSFEERTIRYWREWVRPLAVPLEWQEAVIRAAITLKLCTFEDTGAILAAMTTSVPEAADSGRNWDYRYCWLRDAFFVVRALNSLSDVATMENYLRFLINIVQGAESQNHLQPVYGIATETALRERLVATLPGYRGMGPVRVGNQAYEHRQHDVYGNVILAATQAFFDQRLLKPANDLDFAHLEWLGARALALHDQPDAGMWELRTKSGVHTSSSLMCWAACDRLARIAARVQRSDRATFWVANAGQIKARILDAAWSDKRNAYTATFGGDDLDCGVLLMGEVGLVDPSDARWLSTVDAIGRELRHGAHLFRYRHADDFGVPKAAFTACTFWYIDALARIGRIAEARELFSTLLERRNPLGLLSEDIDIASGELWGNFPQTYSLVGIINCATRLSRPWDSVL